MRLKSVNQQVSIRQSTRGRARSMFTRVAVAISLAATLVAVPGTTTEVAQAASWSPEAELSSPTQGGATDLVAALSDDGTTAVAAWNRSDGTNTRIEVATASITLGGATWSSPIQISAAGRSASLPSLAISGDGSTILLAWDRGNNSNFSQVQAVVATVANGVATWGPVTDLSPSNFNGARAKVGINSTGSLGLVAWSRWDGSNWRTEAVTGTITGGVATWGTPAFISPAGTTIYLPEAAMSRDGNSVGAVWEAAPSGRVVTGSTATTSGAATAFTAAAELSDAQRNANSQQLTIENGVGVAAWIRTDGSNWIAQMRSATIGAGAPTWEPVTNLSVAGQSAFYPSVDLDSSASVGLVAWTRSNGTNHIAQARVVTLSGATTTVGAVADLSATGQSAQDTKVVMAANGTKGAVIWGRPDGSGNGNIQVAIADISGGNPTWGTAEDLSIAGQSSHNPLVAMSSDGKVALATWLSELNGVSSVRARVLNLNPATVTFDANGGSGTMAAQSSAGSANLNANTFARSGHSFVGWNTAANGSGQSYADGASFPFTANTTLYAQWQADTSPQASADSSTTTTTTTTAPAAVAQQDQLPVTGAGDQQLLGWTVVLLMLGTGLLMGPARRRRLS